MYQRFIRYGAWGADTALISVKKLGPNVLDIVEGVAKPVRPQDCIGDGACMVACPTKAIFLMSKYDPASPPSAV